MSWLSHNHKTIQLTLLLLLLTSFIGPWNYTADGVPPAEYCDPPLVLLTPDRCVKLVPGAEMVAYLVVNAPQMLLGMLNGEYNLSSALRELAFVIIILLPALPVLVLGWRVLASLQPVEPATASVKPPGLWGRIVLYASLTLGWLAALGLFLLNWPPQPWLFWGLWLYLILNDAILMLDILSQVGTRPASAPV